jgi:type IV pilus assembly protein PilV
MRRVIAARSGQRASPPQRGMSLVEVLVALLVLSVGMLGIAVMFVQSVRSSRSAILRTQAVNLVSDMADRIRANANAQAAYDMDTYGGKPQRRQCAPDDTLKTGKNCNVNDLAEDDLARWKLDVENTLPPLGNNSKATAVVDFTSAAAGQPEVYRIRVAWREPNEQLVNAGNGSNPSYSYQSDVVLMPRRAVP